MATSRTERIPAHEGSYCPGHLPLPDEVPAFWACAVTPQAVIMAARPDFAITHAPGYMFITDVPDAAIRGRLPTLAALVP
jgi:hypothetical protein